MSAHSLNPPTTVPTLVWRSFHEVLPRAGAELDTWQARARAIPDPELQRQAVASLTAKRFHADGGSVYATAVPRGPQQDTLIRLIVAFQTISDYLDNLCDRSTSLDPVDFRQLHRAMIDSVDPAAPLGDYYRHRPQRSDGGYLEALVRTCQECAALLPSYPTVARGVRELVERYADLQVHKHVRLEERVPRLTAWFDTHRPRGCDLHWWEYSAATGSTLGVFMLFLAALDRDLQPAGAAAIHAAYFPWVCGLHILLDYLIDQDEDRHGGDLNFVGHYPSRERAYQRIELFAQRAVAATRGLPAARFHRLVIEGLVAMYLSDAKVVGDGAHRAFAWRLTGRLGPRAAILHLVSRAYRLRAGA